MTDLIFDPNVEITQMPGNAKKALPVCRQGLFVMMPMFS